jgi:iron complex transport system substrate-binding protein
MIVAPVQGAMNVVTLLPSATEIVTALGIDPVAVSHECDYPPRVADRPAVTAARIDADGASATVNEQVARAEQGEGVYEIDCETLAAVDPDLVVTQGICDVCAVDRVLVADAIDTLGLDAEVLTTDPHTLADVLDDIERIGAALGRSGRAADLVAGLRERIAAATVETSQDRPRTVVLDWMDPPMVAGHWIPGMIERAGGAYGLADPGARSRPREWEAIRSYDPERLVVAPCGFDIDRTVAHLDELRDRPGWADLTAVDRDAVYVMDGDAHMNRPGPRLVDSLAALAAIVAPDREPPADVARPIGTLTVE